MTEFRWHATADELPAQGLGKYLLLGKGGAIYVATSYSHESFYVPNNRHAFKDASSVRAWAEIPEYKEVRDD